MSRLKHAKCQALDDRELQCRLDEGHRHGYPDHVAFLVNDDGKLVGLRKWRDDG